MRPSSHPGNKLGPEDLIPGPDSDPYHHLPPWIAAPGSLPPTPCRPTGPLPGTESPGRRFCHPGPPRTESCCSASHLFSCAQVNLAAPPSTSPHPLYVGPRKLPPYPIHPLTPLASGPAGSALVVAAFALTATDLVSEQVAVRSGGLASRCCRWCWRCGCGRTRCELSPPFLDPVLEVLQRFFMTFQHCLV